MDISELLITVDMIKADKATIFSVKFANHDAALIVSLRVVGAVTVEAW